MRWTLDIDIESKSVSPILLSLDFAGSRYSRYFMGYFLFLAIHFTCSNLDLKTHFLLALARSLYIVRDISDSSGRW